jgi:hypothetical protein
LHVIENDQAAPHQAEMGFGQLNARHPPAVVIVAAFLRIPRMRAGGADEEKLRCHEQTDKLSHFDLTCPIPTECAKARGACDPA